MIATAICSGEWSSATHSVAARGDALGHGNITVAQLVSVWRSTALPARDVAERTIHSYEWAIGVIVSRSAGFASIDSRRTTSRLRSQNS